MPFFSKKADKSTISSNSKKHPKNESSTTKINLFDKNLIPVINNSNIEDEKSNRFSKLNQTLTDTLKDDLAVQYFLHFLESTQADHLLKFWLDVENFKNYCLKIKNSKVCNAFDHNQDMYELSKNIKTQCMNIYRMYIAHNCLKPIGVCEDLRNYVMSLICCDDGSIDTNCFVHCQEFVIELFHTNYWNKYLSSQYFSQYQISLLTGESVLLTDIIFHPPSLFYFMEYLEREKASILLECWMALDNFEFQLITQDFKVSQDDAIVIYDKYFSLQATSPIGFDDNIRIEIEKNICLEEGPLPTCFQVAHKQLFAFLKTIHLPAFLKSDLHLKYLNEIVSSVKYNQYNKTDKCIPSDARKKSLSSVNSVTSLQSQNDEKLHLPMDTAYIDGDSLWQRPVSTMSLGKINEFGQFVSSFEPEPENDKNNFVENFFRRNKYKEKTQDELASQVAQMIIRDVNSLTNSKNSDVSSTLKKD